ncbi:LysR substrate-binding domain-containing protein [Paraburkholderia susongensis]|uniref:DNA-binding transcriptional regulator, LysR family n=1 Tax=Paraburkholderia susongensis TaxID=1515439 RepID=A0A1X7LVY8_9BURK|nr:LysR substrate-binding domain-containing protein [Paraburkholderia susongensis]SMG57860.1 DNA-binding transcriptional regulator, LysR family [Paraburkholderia susongensis]
MRNLDIDLLRTFVAIAQRETFASAAEQVGRTQSAITQQMQRLEQEVGCVLFEKRGRQKTMTTDGSRLLAYAHKILALNDQAVQLAHSRGVGEKVRIGSPHDVADSILPNMLRRLSKLSTGLQMEINVGRSPFLMDALRDGKLDLVISTRYNEAFPGVKLRTSPMVWICAEDFTFNPGEPVPLVMADELSLFRKLSIAELDAHGIPWCTSFISRTLTGIKAAISAGLGVTARTTELLDANMRVLTEGDGLPRLPEVAFYLYVQPTCTSLVLRELFESTERIATRFGPAFV